MISEEMLKEKTEHWIEWLLRVKNAEAYFEVIDHVFKKIDDSVSFEYYDKDSFIIISELFGEDILACPNVIQDQMMDRIKVELNKRHDLFDYFKLYYAWITLGLNLDEEIPVSCKFMDKFITLSCNYEHDTEAFEAIKLLSGVYL